MFISTDVRVTAPVKWIYIVADRSLTESLQSTPAHDAADGGKSVVSLGLTEGRPVPIRCRSHGGHPAPHLSVFLDRLDITDKFEASHDTDVRGPPGLRTAHYRSSCWTEEFVTSSVDDGRSLRCVASVAGVDVASANVTLVVRCTTAFSFKVDSCESKPASMSVSPSVRPQKVSPIRMNFGV